MKKSLIKVFFLIIFCLEFSCSDDELTYEIPYTPPQLIRILTADSTKYWVLKQNEEIVDCEKGALLKFKQAKDDKSFPKLTLYADPQKCDTSLIENKAIYDMKVFVTPPNTVTDNVQLTNEQDTIDLKVKYLTSRFLEFIVNKEEKAVKEYQAMGN